jgi:hypothetical protein
VPITVPRAVRFCGDFLGYFRIDQRAPLSKNGELVMATSMKFSSSEHGLLLIISRES